MASTEIVWEVPEKLYQELVNAHLRTSLGGTFRAREFRQVFSEEITSMTYNIRQHLIPLCRPV
jgi:hypothetical protein